MPVAEGTITAIERACEEIGYPACRCFRLYAPPLADPDADVLSCARAKCQQAAELDQTMSPKVVLFSAVTGVVLVMMAASPSRGELIDLRTVQLREGTEAVCDGVGDEGARATVVAYQGQRYTVCQYIPHSRYSGDGPWRGRCRIYGEEGRYGFEVRCLSDRNTCPPLNGSRTDPYGDHACLLAAYPADIREHVIMAARFSDDDPVVAEDPEAVTTLAIARARRW